MEILVFLYVLGALFSVVMFVWFIVTMNAILRELREIKTQVVYIGELGDYISSHSMFDEDESQR
jgi:hypothetical protein